MELLLKKCETIRNTKKWKIQTTFFLRVQQQKSFQVSDLVEGNHMCFDLAILLLKKVTQHQHLFFCVNFTYHEMDYRKDRLLMNNPHQRKENLISIDLVLQQKHNLPISLTEWLLPLSLDCANLRMYYQQLTRTILLGRCKRYWIRMFVQHIMPQIVQ